MQNTKKSIIIIKICFGFEGLFQGVIAMSGCAVAPFALYRPPFSQIKNARSLAKQLGCPLYSPKVMVDCLKQIPAEDIVKVEPEVLYFYFILFCFHHQANYVF